MSKKLPERYDPGELEKTRENLGSFSREEALRMSDILGGDIGVERSSEDLEQKYRRLEELNRRRSDAFPKQVKKGAWKPSEAGSIPAALSDQVSPFPRKIKPPYIDRVRINFLASGKDHLILTKGCAFATLFSFMFKVRERINPDFIIHGDELFFHQIENLVLGVTKLLKVNDKAEGRRLPDGLHRTILEIISQWNVERLHLILGRFQKRSRNITFEMSRNLCRDIYTPIVRLIEMDAHYHIESALKRVFDLNILAFQSNKQVVKKLKGFYLAGREANSAVFLDMKYRLFPLLLKFVSDRAYSYEEFFILQRMNILSFLELSSSDILMDYGENGEEREETSPALGADTGESAGEEISLDEKEEHIFFIPVDTILVLERLFPKAGFSKLSEFPDLYRYFQPLFDFPRGVELIPPADPLHQVVVILEILKDLFFGFRDMKFGCIADERGNHLEIQPLIERITGRWHLFLDEVIINNYTAQLYDFCREIERNPQFRITEYGMKSVSDLLWIKRLYLFPFLKFEAIRGTRPQLGSHIVPLFNSLQELKELLEKAGEELEQLPDRAAASSIKNPWEPYTFEVENPVSRRLTRLIQCGDRTFRRFESASGLCNANLLLCTRSVLRLLDLLINTPESFYYQAEETELYRSDDKQQKTPVYTVDLLDTPRLMEEALEPLPPQEEKFDDHAVREEVIGVLRREIDKYHTLGNQFSLLTVSFSGTFTACGDGLPQKAADLINDTIREFSDSLFTWSSTSFLIILPETGGEEAVSLTRRVMEVLVRAPEIPPPSFAVVQFQRTWGPEKLLKIMDKAALDAAGYPDDIVTLYDAPTATFRKVSLT